MRFKILVVAIGCSFFVACGGPTDAGSLAEQDAKHWCQKNASCGLATSVEECVSRKPPDRFKCVHTDDEIRACLTDLDKKSCADLMATAGTSCLPLRKSPDGC